MKHLITVVAEMKAKPGKEEVLLKVLLEMVEHTRKEAGCVQYDLHVSPKDAGQFLFYENWESEEHLAKHAASEHLKKFGEVRGDLLEAAPRVDTFRRVI